MSISTDKIIINKGGDFKFEMFLQDEEGRPFNITGATPLDVEIPLEAGGCLVLSLGSGVTITNAGGGVVEVEGSEAQAGTLKEGVDISFEAEITIAGKKTVVQFIEGLDVIPEICI